MDVNGAKALKKRLGLNGDIEPKPARAEVEVPEDAPPVYQWLGVSQAPPDGDGDGDEPAAAASLFRRLGISCR